MDSRNLYLAALESATTAINLVSAADYLKPTPDSKWDVKTLANHMLYELKWTPDIVRGKTIIEVGTSYDGDLIRDRELAKIWQEAVVYATEAVKECDIAGVAHLSWRDATNDYYLKQAASDQLIHSLDLSAALASPLEFKKEVAQIIYDNNIGRREQMASSGLFAPALEVPEDVDIQTKLLALFGRSADWTP